MEKSSIHRIVSGIKRYVGLQREFVMLTLAEKLTIILTAILVTCIIMLLALLVLVFVSLTLSSLLAEMTGSEVLGYGIVSLFYIIVAIVVYANRGRWIANPIANFLATSLLDGEKTKTDNTES